MWMSGRRCGGLPKRDDVEGERVVAVVYVFTFGGREMDDVPVFLEHVHLLDRLDGLNVELLEGGLEFFVVGAGGFVDFLLLSSGCAFASLVGVIVSASFKKDWLGVLGCFRCGRIGSLWAAATPLGGKYEGGCSETYPNYIVSRDSEGRMDLEHVSQKPEVMDVEAYQSAPIAVAWLIWLDP